jgi:hypothetical protein
MPPPPPPSPRPEPVARTWLQRAAVGALAAAALAVGPIAPPAAAWPAALPLAWAVSGSGWAAERRAAAPAAAARQAPALVTEALQRAALSQQYQYCGAGGGGHCGEVAGQRAHGGQCTPLETSSAPSRARRRWNTRSLPRRRPRD